MSILVIGPSKSGTTALFYAIREKRPNYQAMFEPADLSKAKSQRTLLVKKLIDKLKLTELPHCYRFDKRIFLIRDPRDRLISYLLYNIWDRTFIFDPEKRKEFIDLVKLKEAEPGAVSVKELLTFCGDLDGMPLLDSYLKITNRILGIWDELAKDFFLLTYEDFVDNKLAPISNYLGFPIENNPIINNQNSRVVRSKGYDNFKSWFLKEDRSFFNQAFEDQLEAFGYDIDFPIQENPIIDPKTSSQYIMKLVEIKLASLQPQ